MDTSPIRDASSADTVSPSISSRVACPMPTSRGSRYAAPMSAPDSPTRVNRNANRASGVHTRKSAASASTAPAPAAIPCTAATIGTGHSRIARITSPVIRVNASSSLGSMASVAPMISLTSPPEQNARPDPRSTTTRAAPDDCRRGGAGEASPARCRNKSRSPAYVSNVSALSLPGRSSVTVATPSAIVNP